MNFYFYDLETSGFSPREARIMQFAGQRTDMDLQPIGKPHNYLIRLTDDVLPDPGAIIVTGITPQKARADGITERQFLEIFYKEIATSGTIFTGFNSIRFDDEFMRYLNYRNFYDPYEWQWKEGRSRWDLLDVVRMTRAIRPEGIKWPVDSSNKPTNRLELLASVNKLEHTKAHDALSDVYATIAVARLLKTKQPKLFEYLLKMRDKKEISNLVHSNEMFLYTSGKYAGEFDKTTVATLVANHPTRDGALVYDLRESPEPFLAMNPSELADAWKWHPPEEKHLKLPVKTLQFNRCPAVAPLGKLEDKVKQRLNIDIGQMIENRKKILNPEFVKNLLAAQKIMDKSQQERLFIDESSVDSQLYEGFIANNDRKILPDFRSADPVAMISFAEKFGDERLKQLIPLYKARNFLKQLSPAEREKWDAYCAERLLSGDENSKLAIFMKKIEELKSMSSLTKQQQYVLSELELYGGSIAPAIF